jgi:hypothetical protein
MRTLPTLPDLLPDYEAALQRSGRLTIDQGLDLAAALYREVRIGAAVPGDERQQDLLLFQYGTKNWYDGRGEYFGLAITRQLIDEIEEEALICQLSLEFEFDPAPFARCGTYNNWSTTVPALAAWVSQQRATAGFRLAQAVRFRAVNVGVQQV